MQGERERGKSENTPEELAEIAYLDKLRLHRKRYG